MEILLLLHFLRASQSAREKLEQGSAPWKALKKSANVQKNCWRKLNMERAQNTQEASGPLLASWRELMAQLQMMCSVFVQRPKVSLSHQKRNFQNAQGTQIPRSAGKGMLMSSVNALERILLPNKRRHFPTALLFLAKVAIRRIHQNSAFVLQITLTSNNWLKWLKRMNSASAEMPLLSNAFAHKIKKSKNS